MSHPTPSVTLTHIMWLLPCSMQLVRSLGEQFKVKYDMGRGVRGFSPGENFIYWYQKGAFWARENCNPPSWNMKKKLQPPLFSWKKNFNPPSPISQPPPLPVINDHSLSQVTNDQSALVTVGHLTRQNGQETKYNQVRLVLRTLFDQPKWPSAPSY